MCCETFLCVQKNIRLLGVEEKLYYQLIDKGGIIGFYRACTFNTAIYRSLNMFTIYFKCPFICKLPSLFLQDCLCFKPPFSIYLSHEFFQLLLKLINCCWIFEWIILCLFENEWQSWIFERKCLIERVDRDLKELFVE